MATIYALTRAMAALELLSRQPVTTNSLAEALLVDRRTARTMLRQLADADYIAADASRPPVYTVAARGRALGSRLASAPTSPDTHH